MSKKPETVFRAKVQAKLDLLPNSWWESIQQKTIQGTPDKLGCINGYFVALELKATPYDVASPLQLLKIQRIVDAGGVAFIIHPGNLDETIEVLKHIAEETTNDQVEMVTN